MQKRHHATRASTPANIISYEPRHHYFRLWASPWIIILGYEPRHESLFQVVGLDTRYYFRLWASTWILISGYGPRHSSLFQVMSLDTCHPFRLWASTRTSTPGYGPRHSSLIFSLNSRHYFRSEPRHSSLFQVVSLDIISRYPSL